MIAVYSGIQVDSETGYGAEFEKGLAIEVNDEEITLYPVNLTQQELVDIIGSLSALVG